MSALIYLLVATAPIAAQTDGSRMAVGEFGQEVAHQYTTTNGLPSNDIARVVAGKNGSVLVETPTGWQEFDGKVWKARSGDVTDTPWTRAQLHAAASASVNAYFANETRKPSMPITIHQVSTSPNGQTIIASSAGFFLPRLDGSQLHQVQAWDEIGRVWGMRDVTGAAGLSNQPGSQDGQIYWFCTPGGLVWLGPGPPKVYDAADGLPYNSFTCLAVGEDHTVWLGTDKGVIRFRDGQFTYRHGKRWLPNDHVTDILAMPDGSAWVATKGGVAHLTTEPMTFAKKAENYEEQIEKYIKRTEYGYVAESFVEKPGDFSAIQHTDSDNDGLWTAMYGAGECFAYGATKDPKAKVRATQAFEALRFLQKVTQGGEHSPPKGYVARTILPTDGPDPNIGRIERDREDQKTDALWKAYEPRWPKSADGKWYWKSDTSSDELDGHYFLYAAYYDLVAETNAEKDRVREVVRDLSDHFLAHNFRLIDHDGTVTRWGDFSPESLNGDRRWYVERGLNSLSMLSYLSVAEHITGDSKYGDAVRLLCEKHHYDQNAMQPKLHFGIGSGNQSDDEMAFMSFYNLIKYTKDDALRERMQHAFFNYWKLEFPELNPFFNIAAAASLNGVISKTQWGTVDLTLFDGWLEDSVAALKGFSLDRFNWDVQNSHRIDLVPLFRHQTIDIDDRAPQRRALRVTGKVLPVEERFFNHYNTDPYHLDYGGDGRMLASGTVFLLPYYMGLYHGFIE